MKKTGKIVLYVLFASFLYPSFLFSNIKLTARLSDKLIGVNEPFTLTITLEGGNAQVNIPDNMTNFALRGSSTSKNIILSGAKLVSIQTINYVYTASKEGIYTIAPIEAKHGGKVYRTKKLVINVLDESIRSSETDDEYNDDVIKELYQLGIDEIYVKNYISKTDVYLNEPIYLSQTAYTRVPIRLLGMATSPSRRDFFTLIDEKEYSTKHEIIDGKSFSVKPLRLEAIYPLKSGIKKVELTSFLFQTSGGIFSDQIEKGFALYNINVLPLPKTDNTNFGGAVGEFYFNVYTSRDKNISIGDSVTVTIQVRGEGNISIIRMPKLDLSQISNFFTLYPVKSHDTNWFDNNGVILGEKKIEYLMVAKKVGNYKSSPLNFYYFSPNTKSYKSVYSDSISISINDDTKNVVSVNNNNNKVYIMPIKNIIIKDKGIFDFVFTNIFLYFYILFGVIISLIFYFIPRVTKLKTKLVDNSKYEYEQVINYYNSNDRLNYCKELEVVLIDSISTILNIEEPVSMSNILIKMEENNIDKEILISTKSIIDDIIHERYSGLNDLSYTDYHTNLANIIEKIKKTYK